MSLLEQKCYSLSLSMKWILSMMFSKKNFLILIFSQLTYRTFLLSNYFTSRCHNFTHMRYWMLYRIDSLIFLSCFFFSPNIERIFFKKNYTCDKLALPFYSCEFIVGSSLKYSFCTLHREWWADVKVFFFFSFFILFWTLVFQHKSYNDEYFLNVFHNKNSIFS